MLTNLVLRMGLPTLIMFNVTAAFSQTLAVKPTGANPTPTVLPLSVTPVTGQPILSSANRGYQIAVSSVQWGQYQQNVNDLTFELAVQHTDGSLVNVTNPQNGLLVWGWTDHSLDETAPFLGNAIYDVSSHKWRGSVSGIDPRESTAHLQFALRDPTTTSAQTTDLTSDLRFNGVVMPKKMDVTQPENSTFTTDWGTVVTLTGVTLVSQDPNSNQREVKYDFSVDHSKVPDDNPQIQFEKAFDNGVQLDGVYSFGGTMQDPSKTSISAASQIIELGSHSVLTLEFSVRENAYSPIKSIMWTPLAADVPLSALSTPLLTSTISNQSTAKFGEVEYRLEHIVDSKFGGNSTYLLWAKGGSPNSLCHITDVEWTPAADGRYYNPGNLATRQYRHYDGAMADQDEFGVSIRDDQQSDGFPLIVTSAVMTHQQQSVSFSKVPLPSQGQTLVLDQQPDSQSLLPIRLRAISWDSHKKGQQTYYGGDSYLLRLTFEYNVSDGSSVGMQLLSALDDGQNSLVNGQDWMSGRMIDPLMQTVVVQIAIPPQGSKWIDITAMLTKNTPTGSPTTLSISRDGKWTDITSTTAAQ